MQVIGAGIFRLPSLVAMQIDSGWIIVGVWVLGGLISLIGALCFAELATAYPHPGGEYHYLTRAFGRDWFLPVASTVLLSFIASLVGYFV